LLEVPAKIGRSHKDDQVTVFCWGSSTIECYCQPPPKNLETIVSHALPLTFVLSRSPAIYKCNFTSANLKVQFTTAIYKLRSTTG
jgi:hypothetical protein